MAMVGVQGEAEELAQESLMAAYRGFAAYRARGTIKAWLFGIARKQCLKHTERRSVGAGKLSLVPLASTAPGADETLLTRQRAERVRDALTNIRPTDREALLLRYVAELSYKDVASACNIEEPTARKRVSRALDRLRTLLTEAETT
jgi:RNA polymerase sigma-70 factor (ECF subfamily)